MNATDFIQTKSCFLRQLKTFDTINVALIYGLQSNNCCAKSINSLIFTFRSSTLSFFQPEIKCSRNNNRCFFQLLLLPLASDIATANFFINLDIIVAQVHAV